MLDLFWGDHFDIFDHQKPIFPPTEIRDFSACYLAKPGSNSAHVSAEENNPTP